MSEIKSQPFIYFTRLAATLVLMFIILRTVNLDILITTISSADILTLIMAASLILIHVFLKSYKWYLLSRELHRDNTLGDALRSYLRGTSLAIVTPSRIGELGRVVWMKGDKLRLGSLTFVDKISELWVVVCFVLLGGQRILSGYSTFVIVLVLALILLFLYQFRRLHDVVIVHIPFAFVRHILHGFTLVSWPLSNIVLLLSFLTMCVYFLQAYILLSAFAPVALATVLRVFPLILLTNLIPVTIGSLGVREGAAIYLLSQFGIAAEVAVAVSLLLFLFDTVIPGVAGSLLFWSQKSAR